MKIAVLNNCAPFVFGGAEHLASALTQKLREYGHESVLVRIPFQWNPPDKILESMLACQMMRVPNVDRVIPIKFPVYLIPHEDKILWLVHQFRQAYDFWGTPFQHIPDTPEGHRLRDVIIQTDNRHLAGVRQIYTNSHVTSDRLRHFNGLSSTVLYPPLEDVSRFACRDYGDFIFCASRINQTKRQHLLVEAMRYVRSDVRLILAGKPEDSEDLSRIRALIAKHGLERRVVLIPEFITEERKVELFADALACAYIPYDEDSYGYVTLEAYQARKPVITCTDSGGITILVKDGQTGYVTEPDPIALATAFDAVGEHRARARALGEAGYALVQELGITWDTVIAKLTA